MTGFPEFRIVLFDIDKPMVPDSATLTGVEGRRWQSLSHEYMNEIEVRGVKYKIVGRRSFSAGCACGNTMFLVLDIKKMAGEK